MEEVMNVKNYDEYKSQLDAAMHQAADAFVRIGYLLRVAKDTDILHESVYMNINDMAKAEYGLTPDQVSRYININERFSEGGYAPVLKEGMQGYGIAKLQIMLTLDDAVVEAIPAEIPKAELQEVAKDIKEEKKITDIEVALEVPEPEKSEFTITTFMKAYFHVNQQQYKDAYEKLCENDNMDTLLDAIAPSGIAMLRARVPGMGTIMLSLKGKERDMELINVRTNENRKYPVKALLEAFEGIYLDKAFDYKYIWHEVYREEFDAGEKDKVMEQRESMQAAVEEKKEEIAIDTNVGSKKEEIAPVQERRETKGQQRIREIMEGGDSRKEKKQSPDISKIVSDDDKVAEFVSKEDENVIKEEYVERNVENVDNTAEEVDNNGHAVEIIPAENMEVVELTESQLKEMKHCARNSLSNANVSIGANAWKAALTDAENLVHYLKIIVERGCENE